MIHTRYYDLTTCTAAVSATEAVHDTMAHYLNTCRTSKVDDPDFHVVVSQHADTVAFVRRSVANVRSNALRRSHPAQRYEAWTTDSETTLLLPEQQTPDHVITTSGNQVTVNADQDGTASTIAIRIIRQLIMRGAEALNGRAVHAGAVDINGQGVLVGGSAGAGKTSVLTRLIEDHGARPIANDRTMLVPLDSGSWLAVGVPLAWRFTPDGINASPRLAEGTRIRHLSRGHDLVDGKVELTPSEVSELLGRTGAATTSVTRMFLLVRAPDATSGTPDAVSLQRHFDFGATDFFAEDWLGFGNLLGGSDAERNHAHEWWARVAATVPVDVLAWTSPAELPQVAAAIAGARL